MNDLIVRTLGQCAYASTWQAMQAFTAKRTNATVDEVWCLEHDPVFTQGQNGKPEHLLTSTDIPVIQTDRGGQITYHGPGQLIVYILMDLQRKKLGVRELVQRLEQTVISTLIQFSITAYTKCGAPGVYTDAGKICSLGLRVRKPGTYHGLALNVDMDLTPFNKINPCGFKGLAVTNICHFQPSLTLANVQQELLAQFRQHLRYTEGNFIQLSDTIEK